MSKRDEALKLAQDWYDSGNENHDDFANMIKQVIAMVEQPAQQSAERGEPVGQLMEEAYGRGQVLWFNKPDDFSMLYTSSQRKPWVGLTEEQIVQLSLEWPAETNDWASHIDFARAIEAELKEKNS